MTFRKHGDASFEELKMEGSIKSIRRAFSGEEEDDQTDIASKVSSLIVHEQGTLFERRQTALFPSAGEELLRSQLQAETHWFFHRSESGSCVRYTGEYMARFVSASRGQGLSMVSETAQYPWIRGVTRLMVRRNNWSPGPSVAEI